MPRPPPLSLPRTSLFALLTSRSSLAPTISRAFPLHCRLSPRLHVSINLLYCPMHKPAFLQRPPLLSSRTNNSSSSYAHPAICSMTEKLSARTTTPSWTNLASLTTSLDFANGPILTSPTKDTEYFRLFGQSKSDVRVIFYRDHALWCPYCHKVQLLLELKQIPYLAKKVNMSCYGSKPVEFLKKVPTGLLPVIELDGQIVTESMDIMFLLEDTFQAPHKKTIPVHDNDMMQAFHRFMRLERVYIGAWLNALRGPLATMDRAIQPVRHTLDIIEKGLNEFDGPYFYPGDEPSFVDINFCTSPTTLFPFFNSLL